MAGILSVLSNSYVLLKSLNLNNTINNAKSYILTQTNLGSLGPGYFTGTGGLCNVLNQIPKMNYPSYAAGSYSPITTIGLQVEYTQSYNITISPPSGMDLTNGLIYVNFNSTVLPMTLKNGIYELTIPSYQYGTQFSYYIALEDSSGLTTVILDSSSQLFKYTVVDTLQPSMKYPYASLVYTDGTYGSGRLALDITDPLNSSGINYVTISVSTSNQTIAKNVVISTIANSAGTYYYDVSNVALLTGQKVFYNYIVYTNAGYAFVYSGNTTVLDQTPPILYSKGSNVSASRPYNFQWRLAFVCDKCFR